jgi:non-specific serine/threonine protein kinase
MAAVSPASSPIRPARSLGRFELRRLLGRSARGMAWLVFDPRAAQERVLVMPRAAPQGLGALERWMDRVRGGARLDHPRLARAVEIGTHEGWPYVAYDRANGPTLAERLTDKGEAAADVARWMVQALDGLAFAHEAGVAHRDIQLHLMALGESGGIRLMGLEAAPLPDGASGPATGAAARSLSIDPERLREQRSAAERDVLAMGLAMHHLLAGRPALDEADIALVIDRLPPQGRELVRLPWSIARQVPEPLRVIVNRATDRQERHRYRGARTLARALEGWAQADAQLGGGTLHQLLERVRSVGALPAMRGAEARAARLASMERERTDEMAELVLRDVALAFDLLRVVNTAQVRGTQVAGNGPVLTVRRAIAMIGIDGVRQAARGLRPWPGPMSEDGARQLEALIDHAGRAGRAAQALRPAGYDAEVVYVVALLQNLGRLVVQYHFPDECSQIRRLMQPAPATTAGGRVEPGMTEETAALAVLGADVESLGAAVARHWGLDDGVLQMIRRLPGGTPVRHPERDEDLLRTVASAANEAVDAGALPAASATAALERVAQRYARALDLSPKDFRSALQGLLPRAPVDEVTGATSAAKGGSR